MAWTNCEIFPGIYNASNGFPFLWLFSQFRWSSCNKLALFSDLSEYHLLGALLEPSLPSRVEREETLNTPILLGGFWQDTDVHLDLFTAEAHTAAAGENASTAGRVEAEKEGTESLPAIAMLLVVSHLGAPPSGRVCCEANYTAGGSEALSPNH